MRADQPDVYQYKPYLYTIAYNMVGEVPAAEDLVQDTFEKWLRADTDKVQDIKPYLSRILINKAIDKLEKIKRERESYKGLWLPEPLVSTEAREDEYSLDYAMLFLLERLNPYERAVFILKEVFSFSHDEVSEMLNITPANGRQIFHRAKEKLRSAEKKNKPDVQSQQQLLNAFLQAVYQKQFDELKKLFIEDIVMYQDGGGKIAAALKPIAGFEKITKFLDAVLGLDPQAVFDIKPLVVTGAAGVLVLRNGIPDTMIAIDTEQDKISKLFFIRNPDKISRSNFVT